MATDFLTRDRNKKIKIKASGSGPNSEFERLKAVDKKALSEVRTAINKDANKTIKR